MLPSGEDLKPDAALGTKDPHDIAAVRAMELQLAKQSAWRKWWLWLGVLGLVILLPFAVWLLYMLFWAHQLASHGG